jgi:hypothetical protein
MDVYLVPAGSDRYDLYCETPTAVPDGPASANPASIRHRLTAVFRRAVAEGEDQRLGAPPATSQSAIRRAITRKLADAVAEQRLLWQLRRQDHARLVHPDDVSEARAMEIARRLLGADRDKHRRWSVIDGVLVVASAPIALLPGPNVLAYYFIFRTVGHFLSMQGAMRGLQRVTWTTTPSSHLTSLRQALALDASARATRLDQISEALGLDRLATFVERTADRSS